MDARALELISALGLTPHLEGGYFREIHRSSRSVDALDGQTSRAALTVIYFLLTAGEVSRWHRVASEEAWYHLEGDPLELQIADPAFDHAEAMMLGPHGETAAPVRVVPAGWWQAARTTGAFTLVSCAVAPGFDYADFGFLRDLPNEVDMLKSRHPALTSFL